MEKIVDYYSELHIDPKSDLSSIQKELIQLERTWKQREITNPEKATKMLALIIDANKAFQNEETRKKYDIDLEESKKEPVAEDPDSKRREQFEKIKSDIAQFFNNKQYDMAQKALEKAENYYIESDDPEGKFWGYASCICFLNEDLEKSMEYVNRALLKDPENVEVLDRKARILLLCSGQASDNRDFEMVKTFTEGQRKVDNTLLSIAKIKNDTQLEITVLQRLSDSYYEFLPKDVDKARKYANQVKDLMKRENGDDWEEKFNESLAGTVLVCIKEDEEQPEVVRSSSSEGGGCYIATAVYGSYNCPQVWVLRRYRDFYLARSFPGRLFIRAYYAISPTVVSILGDKKTFNCFWKKVLDAKITRLKGIGVSDAPYEDR